MLPPLNASCGDPSASVCQSASSSEVVMPRSKFFCEAPLTCSSIFVMAEKLQQHAAVKFCFLVRKTAGETVVMLETAYKEAALGKTQVYEWFSHFRNGELSLADQPRSGRSSTARMDENIAWIRELILEDRRRTTDELVDLSGVSWSSCQRILSEELQMKRVAAKFVPHVLTADQKQSQVDACLELKEHLEINPDLFLRSLLVTKAGAMPMTQRRSSSQANGRVQIHHVPKKCGECSQMSRRCRFLFLMQTVLFTQNSFLMVKMLTRRFTYKFWNVSVTRWDENAPSCGKVGNGGFTTTTRQHRKPWVWKNF